MSFARKHAYENGHDAQGRIRTGTVDFYRYDIHLSYYSIGVACQYGRGLVCILALNGQIIFLLLCL